MKNTLFIVLSYIAKSLMVLASVCYGSACIVMIIEAMMHSWEEINIYNYIFPSDLIAISAYMLAGYILCLVSRRRETQSASPHATRTAELYGVIERPPNLTWFSCRLNEL
jgi:ABC-type thiamin/hydroxymethylpyrimidine transport system permease subunit